MNREIKFRAWLRKHLKLVNVKRIDFEAQEIVYEEIDFEYEDVIREKTALFKDISMLQYIGKSDVHDVDICVGDIVKVHYEYESYNGYVEGSTLCVVKYVDEWCKTIFQYLNDKDGNYYSIEDLDMNDVEVIDNIYENRDLLENE